jgi:hypothetical protein
MAFAQPDTAHASRTVPPSAMVSKNIFVARRLSALAEERARLALIAYLGAKFVAFVAGCQEEFAYSATENCAEYRQHPLWLRWP